MTKSESLRFRIWQRLDVKGNSKINYLDMSSYMGNSRNKLSKDILLDKIIYQNSDIL